MANPQTFGELLRAGRVSRGMSAGQLAEQLDRSRASIRSWERNESEPSPADVERLVELLELDRSKLAQAEATDGSDLEDPPDDDAAGSPDESEPHDDDPEAAADQPVDAREGDADDGNDAGAEEEEGEEVDAEADTIAHPMLPVAVAGHPDGGFDQGGNADPGSPAAAIQNPKSAGPGRTDRSDSGDTSSTASSSSLPEKAPRKGFFATIRDPEKPWLGYIRAFLTIVVLAALGWAFLWAVRELFAAVRDLRGSETNGVEALAFMVLLRTRAR